MNERIIAVGLLSQRDLEVLGRNFTRHFPLQENDDLFADLLAKLDPIPFPANSSKRRPREA
ncbi:hypothetical protein WG907_11410 [Sphingobium sp. AN558]|uniref:hypothetical protein n=1 Tax=Sphingobium sp. AN558 TaxID=3133442 RepID=UPI0030C499CC